MFSTIYFLVSFFLSPQSRPRYLLLFYILRSLRANTPTVAVRSLGDLCLARSVPAAAARQRVREIMCLISTRLQSRLTSVVSGARRRRRRNRLTKVIRARLSRLQMRHYRLTQREGGRGPNLSRPLFPQKETTSSIIHSSSSGHSPKWAARVRPTSPVQLNHIIYGEQIRDVFKSHGWDLGSSFPPCLPPSWSAIS